MAYPSFPVMQCGLRVSIVHGYTDETIESKMENGLRITRARFPRIRRTWAVELAPFGQADFNALDYFVRSVVKGGAGAFTFTLPATGESVLVRFLPDKCPKPQEAGMNGAGVVYTAAFDLEEV
jgi:hypothetical protein